MQSWHAKSTSQKRSAWNTSHRKCLSADTFLILCFSVTMYAFVTLICDYECCLCLGTIRYIAGVYVQWYWVGIVIGHSDAVCECLLIRVWPVIVCSWWMHSVSTPFPSCCVCMIWTWYHLILLSYYLIYLVIAVAMMTILMSLLPITIILDVRWSWPLVPCRIKVVYGILCVISSFIPYPSVVEFRSSSHLLYSVCVLLCWTPPYPLHCCDCVAWHYMVVHPWTYDIGKHTTTRSTISIGNRKEG